MVQRLLTTQRWRRSGARPDERRRPGAGCGGLDCGPRRRPVRLQHAALPHRRFSRDVDGRRLRHARSRDGTLQERLDAVPQEYRPVFHRRPDVTGSSATISCMPVLMAASSARRARFPSPIPPPRPVITQPPRTGSSRWCSAPPLPRSSSGTIAERMKLGSFLIFVVILTGILYPITGAWQWGRRLACRDGLLRLCRLHPGALRGRLGGSDGRTHHRRAQRASIPRTARSMRCRAPRCRWPRWGPSSSGSAGSASTAARSLAMGTIEGRFVRGQDLHEHQPRRSRLVWLPRSSSARSSIKRSISLSPSTVLWRAWSRSRPSRWHLPRACRVVIGAVGGAIVVFAVPLLDKLKIDDGRRRHSGPPAWRVSGVR